MARATATVLQWVALALAIALIVIGLAPRSPVRLDLAVEKLSSLDQLGGLTPGVVVDPASRITVRLSDPSFGLRMLNLGGTVPGLLVIAEIARRMARLLRTARNSDPFTITTAHDLNTVAKITAFGGLGAWGIAAVTRWLLSSQLLATGSDVSLLHQSPLGWLGAGLIIAGLGQIITRGVAMRTELDTII